MGFAAGGLTVARIDGAGPGLLQELGEGIARLLPPEPAAPPVPPAALEPMLTVIRAPEALPPAPPVTLSPVTAEVPPILAPIQAPIQAMVLVPKPRPLDVPAVAAVVTAASEALPAPPTEVEVRRGDTLLDILTRAGIETGEAHDAVTSLRKVTNLRRLQVGQRLALEVEPVAGSGARLAKLVFPVDAGTEVHLTRSRDGGFAARSVDRPLQREMVRVRAEIADSVYQSARNAGLPVETLGQMIKLLSWDVDFQRDVHPGDRFETVFERRTNDNGEVAAAGELLFVGLDTREREIEAYRFTPADGRAGFFDRDGRALRKWLLKTPIDGARLSSRFGPRRHPVLGYTRMHQGIDFAAPPGTPVLAAGDGVVDFAGRNKGYGKYVRLQHNGEYSTAYAHLSRFAAGMKRGRRIKQGEVIGYVGSTGLSTGPHLHYEVLLKGEQVNPLGIKAAFADQLQGAELKRFIALRNEVDRLRRRPDREQMVAQRVD